LKVFPGTSYLERGESVQSNESDVVLGVCQLPLLTWRSILTGFLLHGT